MLKRTIVLLALPFLFMAQAHAAEGSQNEFQLRLSGAQEDPTVITDGLGSALLRIRGNTIAFHVRFRNLESNLQAAHIHIGANDTTGGIAAFLCSSLPNPPAGTALCPPATAGQLAGVIDAADVILVPEQGVPAGDIAALIKAIRTGLAYVNLHSVSSPKGEFEAMSRRTSTELTSWDGCP